jgi:hypothetical protein
MKKSEGLFLSRPYETERLLYQRKPTKETKQKLLKPQKPAHAGFFIT